MIYSHQSSWKSCSQHEQQISMLQEKIMQLHNKLIDQLDICKQQELTIIELNLKLNQSNKNKNVEFDTFKDQSFGQHRYQSQKENYGPRFNHQHHSSDESLVKNELLKADLQAMRSKVLMEIKEKNELKEELKEQRMNHRKEMSFQLKKFEGLESILRKLQEQHKYLLDKHQRMKRDQSQVQHDKVPYRMNNNDIQPKHHRQKQINKRIQSKNKPLMTEQLQNLPRQKNQSYQKVNPTKDKRYHNNANASNINNQADVSSSYGKKPNEKVNKMQKYSITNLQKQLQLRDNRDKRYNVESNDWSDSKQDQRYPQDKRYADEKRYKQTYDRHEKDDRFDERKKKRGFEETKQLIKKLEQAEISMRKNRKPIS